MRFATDTGGTFTDLIIEDDGRISMFKAATVPSEPVKGVLDAFEIAAAQLKPIVARCLAEARHSFTAPPMQSTRSSQNGPPRRQCL